MQVLCSIYGNIDKGISRSICHHGRKEKECHDNDSETVPRQRIGYPVAHGDTGAKGSRCECDMQDDGVLPNTGFPQVGDKETSDNLDTAQTRASQTSQAFVTDVVWMVIPLRRALSKGFKFDAV